MTLWKHNQNTLKWLRAKNDNPKIYFFFSEHVFKFFGMFDMCLLDVWNGLKPKTEDFQKRTDQMHSTIPSLYMFTNKAVAVAKAIVSPLSQPSPRCRRGLVLPNGPVGDALLCLSGLGHMAKPGSFLNLSVIVCDCHSFWSSLWPLDWIHDLKHHFSESKCVAFNQWVNLRGCLQFETGLVPSGSKNSGPFANLYLGAGGVSSIKV